MGEDLSGGDMKLKRSELEFESNFQLPDYGWIFVPFHLVLFISIIMCGIYPQIWKYIIGGTFFGLVILTSILWFFCSCRKLIKTPSYALFRKCSNAYDDVKSVDINLTEKLNEFRRYLFIEMHKEAGLLIEDRDLIEEAEKLVGEVNSKISARKEIEEVLNNAANC